MRWLAALAVVVALGVPTAAQAQLCGAGAPYWYTPGGWFPTGAYGPTGCYWVPASSNGALQPQLYPSQQQPTTTSMAGFGNAGAAGWYLYPPGLGPSLGAPFGPSGYSAGGSSVAPATIYPAVAGAPINPWEYPGYVWNESVGAWLRQAPVSVATGSNTAPVPVPASPPPAARRGDAPGTASDQPPAPGRGGGNYVGDDPNQRDTVTIVWP